MKTVSTSVGFQDPLGNLIPAPGALVLDLSQSAEVTSGGGLLAPKRVVLPLVLLTGRIAPTLIYFNDELSPSGTTYHATLIDGNTNLVADFGQWFIAGVSADLSFMVPVAGGGSISVVNAVLLNPVAQQNINAQTLNMEGASLSFSATASTTADSFFSRLAAGVIGVGTAIGNAFGSLKLASATFSSNSLNLIGTAGSPVALSGGTGATNDLLVNNAANTKALLTVPDTGGVTLGGATSGGISILPPAVASGTNTLQAVSDTFVYRATTDRLTSKTLGGIGSTTPFTLYNRIKANQGTAIVPGDVGSLVGWGTTATVSAVTGTDSACTISITSNGTGQAADATFTLTYHDGTWTADPIVVSGRLDGNVPAAAILVAPTPTTLVVLFNGVPVAGTTYTMSFISIGK